jgi:hypothetical protein
MFVYVRLIDTRTPISKQKTNIQQSRKNQQDPEKPTGHPTGNPDPKKDQSPKPMFM